ncbi:MAG: ComEC family competence protein [Bacteroidetes bacterium]|nr:MAG: ComEC family competence protein [Bacteroidota bacterium]REK07056.1 MAG: ComEC family competence protein [Bacteroidota bacterium]REK33598.1 MAG: ComEC family competence protein [Bacteroidota bacterium]REK48582.1 MAG: ComEC family competence protein [Bacteroidota bacterium]
MHSEPLPAIFKLLISACAGIFIASAFPLDPLLPAVVAVLLLIAYLIFLSASDQERKYSWHYVHSVIRLIFTVYFFFILANIRSERFAANHFMHADNPELFIAVVDLPPVMKGKNIRTELEVKRIKYEGEWRAAQGRCLLYIKPDSSGKSLKYGDLICFSKKPEEPSSKSNPGQFDFKKWLAQRQVYRQVYLGDSEFYLLGNKPESSIKSIAISWRDKLLDLLSGSGMNEREYAVLSALLLGQDDEIDSELLSAFAGSGVMHVLAVSGMHVGLIYGALCILLRYPGTGGRKDKIKSLILISCVWLYALVTGLSPSILRASCMLSLLIVSRMLSRKTPPLNILYASAIILFLTFGPAILFSAGFQLSFMAVAGIMWMYKPLHSLYCPGNYFLRNIWSVVCVSIVAQLATFPLSVHYFNRFPVYFLPANIVVLPLASICMFGGIAYTLIAWIDEIASYFSGVLSFFLLLLNQSVMFINALPASNIEGIKLGLLEMILLYMLIAAFIFHLMKAESPYIKMALVFLSFLLFCFSLSSFRTNSQQFFTLYQDKNLLLMEFCKGRSSILISDSVLMEEEHRKQRILKQAWLEHGIVENTMFHLPLSPKSFAFGKDTFHVAGKFAFEYSDKSFLICSGESDLLIPDNQQLDFLILKNNPGKKTMKLLEDVKVKYVISGPAMTLKATAVWNDFAQRNDAEFHSLRKQGAFVYHFR